MKKLIIVMLAVAFLFVAVEAKAVVVFKFVPLAAEAGAATVLAKGGAIAIGTMAIWTPYWIQFANHPECRKEPTIGDMSDCVQYGKDRKVSAPKNIIFGKEVK
jgi:hypothetical protein